MNKSGLQFYVLVMCAVLAILKLSGSLTISWWVTGGLAVVPLVLIVLSMLFFQVGVEVASELDVDPNSHKSVDDTQDLVNEVAEEILEELKKTNK